MRAYAKRSSTLLMGAMFVVGCSAGGEPGAAVGEAAVYRVPVPAEMEPWAAYPVQSVEIHREGDAIKIEYPFPTWLAGEAQQVELSGTYAEGVASFSVTAGALGDGDCVVTGAHFRCTEQLPGVLVNRASAEASMNAAGLPGQEVGQRLLVTDTFSVDPIGIIEFDLVAVADDSTSTIGRDDDSTSTTGSAGSGGATSSSGSTGGGGALCPPAMPQANSLCDVIEMECHYGGECACECEDEGVWECKKC